MPQLGKQQAKQAHDHSDEWQGGGSFPVLEPGLYLLRLRSCDDVDTRNGNRPLVGPAGPYWKWEFEEVHSNRRIWHNTSLSEKSIGQIGKIMACFGVPADTDTAELVGQIVGADVGVEVMRGGKNQGAETNTILDFLPPAEVDEEFVQFAGPPPTTNGSAGREAEAAATRRAPRAGAKDKTWDEEPF